jgi:hypothetical protein
LYRKALFITNKLHIGEATGGVQTCTRDYLNLLEALDFAVDLFEIDVDMQILTRLRRTLRSSAYEGSMSKADKAVLVERSQKSDIVFLNQVNLANNASLVRSRNKGGPPVVLLSHGAEVTDLFNLIRTKKALPLSGRLRPTPTMALRNVFLDEINARQGVTGALCLSQFDTDFERWLGVRHVAMVPRTLLSRPLVRRPIFHHFGYLGTLDHAPNLEGLVEVLEAIDRLGAHDIQIRVVGSPERLGRWLTERYKCVIYLGPLAEDTLLPEASTWSAFLNPIFCQARGCSTKLATALGWELPIITTPVGRRGYVFSEGSMIEANSPDAFVEAMLSLVNPSRNKEAQIQVTLAAKSCPSMADNARMIRPFFDMLMRG